LLWNRTELLDLNEVEIEENNLIKLVLYTLDIEKTKDSMKH
jgi:hypothetical protein